MPSINMRSAALTVKGQGVGSCYEEQVSLVMEGLSEFDIYENSLKICDIMHYHTVNFRYYIERLIRGRKAINVGYVHFLPETLEDSLRLNRLFKMVFYRYLINFYNSMDYLIMVNPCIMEKIKNHDLNRPKLICIPNFVSKKNFYPISAGLRPKLRAEYGLSPDVFTVLGVGQLQTRKGIHDFVETAQKLPEIQFIWAGGFSFGKMSDGYEQIKHIVDNPPQNVKFLGIVDRSEMNSLYNACDIMFLPSFDELFPMTVLEALACEKPILLRDIDIYKSILSGSYIKADDTDGFAREIKIISEDYALYEKWSKISANASEKYSEENALKMWRDFYTSIYTRSDKLGLRSEIRI